MRNGTSENPQPRSRAWIPDSRSAASGNDRTRDRFASLAMTALCADSQTKPRHCRAGPGNKLSLRELSLQGRWMRGLSPRKTMRRQSSRALVIPGRTKGVMPISAVLSRVEQANQTQLKIVSVDLNLPSR
jgi:hypothetical protein